MQLTRLHQFYTFCRPAISMEGGCGNKGPVSCRERLFFAKHAVILNLCMVCPATNTMLDCCPVREGTQNFRSITIKLKPASWKEPLRTA